MMILDFPDQLRVLREMSAGESIEAVLSDSADGRFLTALDALIMAAHRSQTSLLGWLTPPQIAARFPVAGDGWMRVRAYCVRHFGTEMELMAPPHLVEALVVLFEPYGSGVWIGPGALVQREPNLTFDKEGLLVGSSELQYTKEGILTAQHCVLYEGIPGVGMSDGFAEKLLEVAEDLGGAANTLRVAVRTDIVLAREFHRTRFTRAYIRGPRGISETILQDPAFPPDPTGTVTEHAYANPDSLANKLFPVVKVEAKWSVPKKREVAVKEVEIEEIVTPDSMRVSANKSISNRYIHAEWSPSQKCFTHFDGARRIYSRSVYDERIRQNLRNIRREKSGVQEGLQAGGRP